MTPRAFAALTLCSFAALLVPAPVSADADAELMLALRGMHPRRDLKGLALYRHILDSDPKAIEKARQGGTRPLRLAVGYHRIGVVELLLERGIDPNDQGGHSDAVTEAIRLGLPDILRVLLVKGAKGTPSDVIEAASRGELACIQLLIEHGQSAKGQPRHGFRPLHVAAEGGRFEIAVYLLKNGAEVDVVGMGRTPLHVAARHGHPEIVKRLLAAGAAIEAKRQDGRLASELAVLYGHESVVRVLVAAGSKSNALVEAALGQVSALQEQSVLLKQTIDGQSLLHVAARFDQLEVAALLLRAGLEVDARTEFKRTPLHLAAARGHLAIARLFLLRGADARKADRSGETPLHGAAAAGRAAQAGRPSAKRGVKDPYGKLVALLLSHGADVHAPQASDLFAGRRWRPLHLAASAGRADLIHLLRAAGAKDAYPDLPLSSLPDAVREVLKQKPGPQRAESGK